MYKTLKGLSEVELVKIYREKRSEKINSLILRIFLFEKKSGEKNWDDNIRQHIRNNKFRLSYHNTSFDEDDLYQEVLRAFHKMLSDWFNVESKYGFSTYAWFVINDAVNRVFQSSRTLKRKVEHYSTQHISLNHIYADNKKYSDLISTNGGIYKTEKSSSSDERIFFCKDLINYLYSNFEEDKINEPEDLINELTDLIKNKITNKDILDNIVIKYDRKLEDILGLKTRISSNIEKQMFKDIIKFMGLNVRDDGIIADRYKCSRGQITKMKQKLSEICIKKLKEDDLTVQDCFKEEHL